LDFRDGNIVLSKAGRDKGKYFIVLKVVDSDFVLIADGGLRKVDNPKLKKCKHLENTGKTSERVCEKLSEGIRVTNPDLLKELADYKTNV
jgi:ribosomal protein L14E/L6E/L27E